MLKNKTVLLYSTGCPSCTILKQMLERAGISYIENNSVDEMLKLGFLKVPVLCVDGVNMNFADAKKWVEQNGKGDN